jgi:hypothetical protein
VIQGAINLVPKVAPATLKKAQEQMGPQNTPLISISNKEKPGSRQKEDGYEKENHILGLKLPGHYARLLDS